jgi:hypothetical protein
MSATVPPPNHPRVPGTDTIRYRSFREASSTLRDADAGELTLCSRSEVGQQYLSRSRSRARTLCAESLCGSDPRAGATLPSKRWPGSSGSSCGVYNRPGARQGRLRRQEHAVSRALDRNRHSVGASADVTDRHGRGTFGQGRPGYLGWTMPRIATRPGLRPRVYGRRSPPPHHYATVEEPLAKNPSGIGHPSNATPLRLRRTRENEGGGPAKGPEFQQISVKATE